MLSLIVASLLQAATPAASRPDPTIDREGRVVLVCKVTRAGATEACRVESEDPPGRGFGEAALSMSDEFKLRPRTHNGQSVDGGEVRIPMRFKLPRDRAKKSK